MGHCRFLWGEEDNFSLQQQDRVEGSRSPCPVIERSRAALRHAVGGCAASARPPSAFCSEACRSAPQGQEAAHHVQRADREPRLKKGKPSAQRPTVTGGKSRILILGSWLQKPVPLRRQSLGEPRSALLPGSGSAGLPASPVPGTALQAPAPATHCRRLHTQSGCPPREHRNAAEVFNLRMLKARCDAPKIFFHCREPPSY